MTALEYKDVDVIARRKSDDRLHVLSGFSLGVQDGEFVAMLGPNGCGKSTLLRLATGLLKPSKGHVSWRGERVEGPDSRRGYLPQRNHLFDFKSVEENVAFGLRMRGEARNTRRAAAAELLDQLGLLAWRRHYPSELSGGMRQRVALAMVLVTRPHLICLDECFGALDFQTRFVSINLLLDHWRRHHPTIVMVTHSVEEALMADRVVVLGGRPATIKLEWHVPHPSAEDRSGDPGSAKIIADAIQREAAAAFSKERATLLSTAPASPGWWKRVRARFR